MIRYDPDAKAREQGKRLVREARAVYGDAWPRMDHDVCDLLMGVWGPQFNQPTHGSCERDFWDACDLVYQAQAT